MANPAFKPYGTPPPFDLDEYKDSFELWHKKWTIFLSLSTIDSALDAAHRDLYKAHTLLSCLSTDTLQAVLSMGLIDAQLDDHTVVIDHSFFVLVAMPAATDTCGASSSPQISKAFNKQQMIGCASCVTWPVNVSLRQIVVLTVNPHVF
jgi:hypothetical protein